MLSAKAAEMLQGLCEEIVTDQQRRAGIRSASVTNTGHLQYLTHSPKNTM